MSEAKNRKIVFDRRLIQICPSADLDDCAFAALANDGTFWVMRSLDEGWEQGPDLGDTDFGFESCCRCPRCGTVKEILLGMGPNEDKSGIECCGEEHFLEDDVPAMPVNQVGIHSPICRPSPKPSPRPEHIKKLTG